jgi:hypothetical protein
MLIRKPARHGCGQPDFKRRPFLRPSRVRRALTAPLAAAEGTSGAMRTSVDMLGQVEKGRGHEH